LAADLGQPRSGLAPAAFFQLLISGSYVNFEARAPSGLNYKPKTIAPDTAFAHTSSLMGLMARADELTKDSARRRELGHPFFVAFLGTIHESAVRNVGRGEP